MPTPKTKEETTIRPQHYVTVEKSVTKNLGDFNSARVSVSITVQVNPTKQEIEQVQTTIDIINETLDSELEEQIKMLMAP